MNLDTYKTDWHVSLHHWESQDCKNVATITYQNTDIEIIEVSASELNAPFPVNFDSFIGSINQLSGGYAEGDGSFGVVGPEGIWKICGTIYERFDAIQYAEIMGKCPQSKLVELLRMLGTQKSECVVQNMQGGFFQTVDQFLASAPTP